MRDLPCIALAATVWAYWFCVGAMSVRVRRRTRKLSGIVPNQPVEQLMWLVWIPLVVAWMVLPYVAGTPAGPPRGLPEFARSPAATGLRWAAVALGFICLALSIDCWLRMGKNWRMAVTPDQQTDLVTTGLFGRVRHPIYALSILLMLCTVVVAPTVAVVVMAVIHIVLMVIKARNEERFLSERHGASYQHYLQRTGRFLPRRRAESAKPPQSP